MPRYLLNYRGIGNAWGDLYDENGNLVEEGQAHGDSNPIYRSNDAATYEEIHVIDPDTNKEIEWFGVLKYDDLDFIPAGSYIYDEGEDKREGVMFSHNEGVYTTGDTHIISEVDDKGNKWYFGTQREEITPESTVWAQVSTSASKPLVIGHRCPCGLISGYGVQPVAINYYITSDSDHPKSLTFDENDGTADFLGIIERMERLFAVFLENLVPNPVIIVVLNTQNKRLHFITPHFNSQINLACDYVIAQKY